MAKEKVCLAYSGGLDTSCILSWLIEKGFDVANVGQEEDFGAAKQKALKVGALECIVSDLREEFVSELCYPAIQVNAIYENVYLLVIARAQIDVAKKNGCAYVSHGCTGKGNDQVRFELAFYALQPGIKVIAPWRDPEFYNRFAGRQALLDYAAKSGIPVTSTKSKPWSMDENLAHCSYEAGILEDPDTTPPADMFKLTQDPLKAPDQPEDFTVEFKAGLPSKLTIGDKSITQPLDLFLAANVIARKHGVGRIDIVENRFIGLKSRGVSIQLARLQDVALLIMSLGIYETPGLTLLRSCHIDLEGLVLDREVRRIRDQFVTVEWSKLLYDGKYFSPEREFLSATIPASQKDVNGTVRARLFKGSMMILGRSSPTSKLYDLDESSMDTVENFSPESTGGFIIVNAIRLKKYGEAKAERGEKM
ncbi:MAG: argininosuccinate synthetase [Chrysothrix sp. TS-e1954]|nr:MAG: argininosuccinate synthetase [Chrysothrix sp. TS-e1954]